MALELEAVTAVLVHHDTNLYDFTVKSLGRTEVIHTTANHLFWDPSLKRWVKAASLVRGEALLTYVGATAVVSGSLVPAIRDGWMWDLTVPGNGDHDFYVVVGGVVAILVHNSGCGQAPYNSGGLSSAAYQARLKAGISAARNVAVALVPGWNDAVTGDLVYGFSNRAAVHSEDSILNQLAARKFDPEQITALYSDRSPCPACDPMLQGPLGALRPGTPISWAVPNGPGSTELLQSMIDRQ